MCRRIRKAREEPHPAKLKGSPHEERAFEEGVRDQASAVTFVKTHPAVRSSILTAA